MKEKILHDWYGALLERDLDTLVGLYSDHALIHTKQGPLRGKASMKNLLIKWLLAMPDLQIYPEHVIVDNDTLIVYWKGEGTLKSPILDLQPTNEKKAFYGFNSFRLQNNQIIEHRATVDYSPFHDASI